jgi:hypothetical protein
MPDQETIWPKKITVDKRIVKILSESTYDSFPHSLKELVVNSYDADARNVHITVDIQKEIIKIEDDGWGMTPEDFDFYLRIAGQRREKGDTTTSGRPVVGQFGVGFLSVFPFFLNYSIETKKSGYLEILHADIPCYQYFTRDQNRRTDVGAVNITGGTTRDKSSQNKSFTRITLSGFTVLTKSFFSKNAISRIGKNSILKEDGITKLKWYLEDDLPLKFEDESFTELFQDEYKGLPFDVYFNTKPLKRRIFGKVLMDHSNEIQTIGNIKYKYFICSNEEPINPAEATGLKIRNLNIGIGKRTTFGLGVETGGTRSRLRWLTGEIHIVDGLNNEIKVSRDDFYFNADYDELKIKFASMLSSIVGVLEDENNVRKFLSTNKINDINFLEKGALSRRVDKVKSKKLEKPQVKESPSNKTRRQNIKKPGNDIESYDASSFEKKYSIKGKEFIVQSEKWDYQANKFPACKLVGNKIIINRKYPLFQKHKHLDIFVRFQVLLLLWLKERKITEAAYSKMSKDILESFSDY